MTTRKNLIHHIENHGNFSFSRAAGSGGQNVNKLNTKVLLTFPFKESDYFSEEEKAKIQKKLSTRINSRGEIFVHAQEERSQVMNRGKAVERMVKLIATALLAVKKRKQTLPSKSAVQRRLDHKKKHAELKRNRSKNFTPLSG